VDYANKLKIEIGGRTYTLTTTEEEAYVYGMAEEINQQIGVMLERGNGLSLNEALVLCVMGYCDLYKKERVNTEHLRSQLKEYLDDAAKVRAEADEAKKNIKRLKKELEKLRAEENK